MNDRMPGQAKGEGDESSVLTRRRFVGTAAMIVAVADLGMVKRAGARADQAPTAIPFRSLRQVDAGVLSIGYAEQGPAEGPPVILLHGWPYDIHTYVDVAPRLAAA